MKISNCFLFNFLRTSPLTNTLCKCSGNLFHSSFNSLTVSPVALCVASMGEHVSCSFSHIMPHIFNLSASMSFLSTRDTVASQSKKPGWGISGTCALCIKQGNNSAQINQETCRKTWYSSYILTQCTTFLPVLQPDGFNEELQATGVDGLILTLQQKAISPLARDVFKISDGELENVSKITSLLPSIIDFFNRPTCLCQFKPLFIGKLLLTFNELNHDVFIPTIHWDYYHFDVASAFLYCEKNNITQISLWLWNTAERVRCPCPCAYPPPRSKWSLLLWDGFVLCEASQLNRLWSGEVSSVDPWVTRRQWWPGFYRKNKNRDPRAHGPCCGRGLGMVGHFREKGKKWRCIRGDVLDLKCRLGYHQVLPSCTLHLGRLFSAV